MGTIISIGNVVGSGCDAIKYTQIAFATSGGSQFVTASGKDFFVKSRKR